jgi:peptidoglycan/LPS O-acetylase OafA/YrhL
MRKREIYFPSLNGIRFIAALLVIIDHVELFKMYLHIPAFWGRMYSAYLGSFGVTIFFTLSGFLITYLLIEERDITGDTNIRDFYIRRILRIWPLYYLIVLLSFFVIPYFKLFDVPEYGFGADIRNQFWKKYLCFIFFMPNYAFIYLETVPYAKILWSVGVEEQFYLGWPLFVKKSNKNVLMTAIIGLCLYLLLKFVISYGRLPLADPSKLGALLTSTRFSCMLIGAISACIVRNGLFKFLYTKWLQLTALIIFFILLVVVTNLPLLNEIISVVVALLIINMAVNKQTIISLENRFFSYLGKISYGLYVYHSIIVVVIIKLLLPLLSYLNYWVWSFLVFITVLGCTVLVSGVSYHYFEKWFLKRKKKFSIIKSGDQVIESGDQVVSL